jgi:pimeloyl-ACP methyl ester carboxylesterase
MTLTEHLAAPGHRTHQVVADGGVELLVRDWGPVDGAAVIYHHATPGSSLSVPGGWNAPDELGIRVVTFDRPGYGGSHDAPGRTVSDAAGWTRAIADALGIARFTLLGAGGGGPHAAAAAAVLGEQVSKLAVVAGVGPDEMPGFDPAAGTMPATRTEIAFARAGEALLRSHMSEVLARPDPLEVWFAHLPPSDVEIIGRGEVRLEHQTGQIEESRQGGDGWIQDDLAMFHRRWGCDLATVTAQTLLLYGAEDALLPSAHGDAYRMALGHGQLVKVPDAGHFLRDYEPDVLRWLVSPNHEPARFTA